MYILFRYNDCDVETKLNMLSFRTICGLTQFTTKAHLARACLEAVCFQTREVRVHLSIKNSYVCTGMFIMYLYVLICTQCIIYILQAGMWHKMCVAFRGQAKPA